MGRFYRFLFPCGPAFSGIVQLPHQIILVLALGGRGLRVPLLLGTGVGLRGVGVNAHQVPFLIAARDVIPDLGLCTVGGVHAHKVDVFAVSYTHLGHQR